MPRAALVILTHQLLFQGLFLGKNVLLRAKLGRPVRGTNREANRAIVFFALFIALALALAWLEPIPGGIRLLPAGAALGLCLLLLAGNLALGIASLRDLGDAWRVGVIEEERTGLVEDGVYGFTRNPYFLAYLLMFAAYTVLLQHLVLLVLSCLGFGLIHAMILHEELYLERAHGETYRRYRQRVPRYLL